MHCFVLCMLSESVMLMYVFMISVLFFLFFKQKTAYEMRISDWSSDVCSSDLCAWKGCGEGEHRHAEYCTLHRVFPRERQLPRREMPSAIRWISPLFCSDRARFRQSP